MHGPAEASRRIRRWPSASTPSAGSVTNVPVAEFLGTDYVDPLIAFAEVGDGA